MDKLDFSNFNFDLSSTLNSMQQISAEFDAQREAQYAAIDQMNREKARRDAKMVAGAEAPSKDVFGAAFKLPTIVKMEMPNPQPMSSNVDISRLWY